MQSETRRVNGVEIAYDLRGQGPGLLLLHGFPQTRAMWGPIADTLATRFTVVTPDLRGYGGSGKPAEVADYSFRDMAQDQLALMAQLGFAQFHLVGHDRGGRTAHRMALDHAAAVQSLTMMDIVPTHLLLSDLNRHVAKAYYHWFFLAQPSPLPETMIGADPEGYFMSCLQGWGAADPEGFEAAQMAAYRKAWADPEVVRGMCNDYRAALELDFDLDAADLGRQVTCPTLVLYGSEGAMAAAYDVAATWAPRCADLRAEAVPGGHFFPDTHPTETLAALNRFLPGP